MTVSRPAADRKLVQIVDHALADAAERAGPWLACHPGCTQCCVGVFAINQLDVMRLQHGLRELRKSHPARANRIVSRARSQVGRLSAEFPGDPKTGALGSTPALKRRFEEFANDEVCPALDPRSGLCELYEYRPMTCRTFGPPVRSEGGLGVCELCFQGASDEQIAACEMVADPDDLESALTRQVESATAKRGETIVAWCLADEPR